MGDGASVRALIDDDEFVLRIARAAGMQTWANSSDHPDATTLQAADLAAQGAVIAQLREDLLAAFHQNQETK